MMPTKREGAALRALLRGPVQREALDRICRVSNSPDVVKRLRRRGVAIACQIESTENGDGETVRFGVYHLPTAETRDNARATLTLISSTSSHTTTEEGISDVAADN